LKKKSERGSSQSINTLSETIFYVKSLPDTKKEIPGPKKGGSADDMSSKQELSVKNVTRGELEMNGLAAKEKEGVYC